MVRKMQNPEKKKKKRFPTNCCYENTQVQIQSFQKSEGMCMDIEAEETMGNSKIARATGIGRQRRQGGGGRSWGAGRARVGRG
jgi:hypothetical protein